MLSYYCRNKHKPKPGDAFIGYHDDTVSSVVLQVCQELGYQPEKEVEWDHAMDTFSAQQVMH